MNQPISIVPLLTILLLVVLFVGCSPVSQHSQYEIPDTAPHYYLQTEREAPQIIECDVAVYGGTPAGVTAAIQAARMGINAVLLSFNQHVGDMTSGGLTATDIGRKESLGGLAMEFYERVGRVRMFRPSEAESLYLEMLDEAGVTVLFERALESGEKKNIRLISMRMETNETFQAGVFIDATYEGDLYAAAGVSYRVGREPSSTYGESLGGQWQDISWKNVYQFSDLPISPFVECGKLCKRLAPPLPPSLTGPSFPVRKSVAICWYLYVFRPPTWLMDPYVWNLCL